MNTKKLVSLLLTLALFLTLAPALGGSAKATVGTSWSGTVTADATETVSGVTLSADTTLTINKGVTLTVNNGIGTGDHTLTVAGPGKLVVTGMQNDVGCTGVSGNLAVTGGTVEVAGGDGTDGAGGHGVSGMLTVSGGTVTVTSGISSGPWGAGHGVNGNVAVSGGVVTVTGGNGGSYYAGNGVNGNIALNGGEITVRGGTSNPSMYNGVSVSGTVTVTGAFTDNAANYDSLTSDQAKEILNSGKTLRQVVAVGTWDTLKTALAAGGCVVLDADVTPANILTSTALVVPDGVSVTLDLNGHIVNRGYTEAGYDGSVIKIEDSGSLTLEDSDPTAAHSPAVTYEDPITGETVTVTGGVITGGYAYEYGGGVSVSGGTFTMNGGNIVGNRAGHKDYGGPIGGGVYISGGSAFTMNGGLIAGNCAVKKSFWSPTPQGKGGGVCATGTGTFTMNGGTIAGNTAGEAGGGVFMRDQGGAVPTFAMTGGTIYNNTANGANSNVLVDAGGTAPTFVTVAFAANDGGGKTMEQAIVNNTASALAPNPFTRAGYTFKGWNTQAEGGGETYADKQSVTLTENTTLYAQWTQNAAPKPPEPPAPEPEPTPVYIPYYEPPFSQQLSPTQSFDGGKVNISPANAREGNTVTLTAVPDEGYQLASLTVTRGKRTVELTDKGENVFTFRMPDEKIAIDAVFEEIPEPEEPIPAPPPEGSPVVLSPQKIVVNGVEAQVEAYNIGGTNFFKLRDLAALLRGTSAQFSVVYDAARRTVVITRGGVYGGEAGTEFTDKSESAARSTQFIELDGVAVSMTAFNIGGNNFFGLRELAHYLGYRVTYDEATNAAIIESK